MIKRSGKTKHGLGILAAVVLMIPAAALSSAATIRQGTVEFMMGSLGISDPRFTSVYKERGGVQGLILSAMLVRDFNFYLEVKHFGKTGMLTYTQEKSDFQLFPLSLGVRYIMPLGIFHPYAGAGGDFYIYYEENPIGTVLNCANGIHALAGAYVQFGKLPVFLNLRLKLTKARAEESGKFIQLGGWEYGAGLAISF